jgi:hypothetical protein
MSEQPFDLVKHSQAKQSQAAKKKAAVRQLTPREELLEFRVTPETKLDPLEFLFKMNGTECFPRSELVANTGKAKSGKTLFLSIVMACCHKKNVLALERICDEPIRVLWYDTEQSAQSTQQILVKRILPLSEGEGEDFNDQFFVFNVRGIGWQKRRELLPVAIEEFKPDLVIVDGTKDLILDINDGTQATIVIEEQMAMAQIHHCCIVDVLHQNKSDTDRNMRGWIGTELTNKAFEVWSCSKVPNTETFKVEHVMSRMKRCDENLYYQLDDSTLPFVCEKPDEQPRESDGRFASKNKKSDSDKSKKPTYKIDLSTINRDYLLPGADISTVPKDLEAIPWDYVKLFTDAMEGDTFKRFGQLMAVAMRIANIDDKPYYYYMVEVAQSQHILVPGKDGFNKQGFFLNSPEQRQRILDYEEEQRRKLQEPQQTTIHFGEPDVLSETEEPVPF